RAANEGLALLVFLFAGALTDDDQLGLRVARSEHHRPPTLTELAERAPLQSLLLRGQRGGGVRHLGPDEGHVGQAQIAVMAEGVGDGGASLAERRAGSFDRAPRAAGA